MNYFTRGELIERNKRNALALSKDQKKHDWTTERVFRQMLTINKIKHVHQKPFYGHDKFCVADFYLPQLKIVIELDGSRHNRKRDSDRSMWLMRKGVKRIVRFKNIEVKKQLKEVELKVKKLFEKNMDEHKLEYYGGSGWEGKPETEFYQIKYHNGIKDTSKPFNSLKKAKEFYDSLICNKACWMPKRGELIECHTLS